ncbi:MAG: hypothetical protein QOJ40_2046 [Verrucomicrobiota bacterium]
MKIKLLPFVVSILVGLNLNVLADEDHEGDHGGDQQGQNEGDNGQGGNIDGSETLIAQIVLVPTNNASATANGEAKLESDNENGTVTATLEIKTQGLDAGDYTLSVVKISDGSSVTLGQISIGTSGDDDGEENDGEGDCHDGGQPGTNSTSVVLSSRSEVELPAGLDPTDIGQIVLSDANGNEVLVGDLVNPTAGSAIKFKASVRVAGANGTSSGKAVMQSITHKGKRKDHFTLIASGVPANSTLAVNLNGSNIGAVKSNKKGKVMVKRLPANLLRVRSVQLMDAQGQTAASVKF